MIFSKLLTLMPGTSVYSQVLITLMPGDTLYSLSTEFGLNTLLNFSSPLTIDNMKYPSGLWIEKNVMPTKDDK